MASSQPEDTSRTYTVIGTPFSTYTRAITLGLTYKRLAFDQVRVVPHSDTAYAYHPFGFLPALIVRAGNGTDSEWKLCESQAIVRYIDRVHPEPSLTLEDDALRGGALPERVWEFVSLAGAHGFPAVEKGVVKPFIATIDASTAPSAPTTVAAAAAVAAPGLPALERFLSHVEARVVPAPLDAYVFGAHHPTWADFFLYPLLSDLRAIEGQVRGGLLSARLRAWMGRMDTLEAVQRTREGTLEAGARPP